MASLVPRSRAGGRTAWLLSFRLSGRQQSITFQDEAEARRWLATFDAQGAARAYALFVAQAEADASTPTVREVVERHIELTTGAAAGTRQRYRRILAGSIAPYLGDLPATVLARQDEAAAWVLALQRGDAPPAGGPAREPLSGKTIMNHFAVLSAAAERAAGDGVIERNGIKGMALPDARPAHGDEILMLTPAEVATLARVIHPHYVPMMLTAVATAARFGEVTAWRKRDFRLSDAQVQVSQAWKEDATAAGVKRWVLGPPKSRAGRRVIPLAPYAVELLREHLRPLAPDDLAFTAVRGGVIRSGAFHGRVWQPALDEALADEAAPLQRRPTWHDLRHTGITWWLRDGVDIRVVQRWAGHESITVTVGRYGHVLPVDLGQVVRSEGTYRSIGVDPAGAVRRARAGRAGEPGPVLGSERPTKRRR